VGSVAGAPGYQVSHDVALAVDDERLIDPDRLAVMMGRAVAALVARLHHGDAARLEGGTLCARYR
jgi:hypothetical protein